MVSKKRLDYGFNGFRAHIVPRAPRSVRRRGSRKKLVEDSQLCAFELLAAVAGKLLQENESSASSNVADGKLNLGISGDANDNRRPEYDKVLKAESYDHGSCAESAFVPEISVEKRNLLSNFKGVPRAENDSVLENKPAHASHDFLKKVDCDMKVGICVENDADGIFTSKVGGTVCIDGSSKHEVGIGPEIQLVDDTNQKGDLSTARTWTVKDPIGECVNTNILMNSESSVQLPLYRDPIPLRKHWKNVKLGIRDDDENSFGCNKFSTRVRPLRPRPCSGNRRIKKILASKYWKAAPKLEDCELYKTSDGMNTYYRYRKGIYTRESCQRVPLKKRKLSDHSFANPYDHFASSDSISNLPDKGTSGTSSTVQGHEKTKDPHVKFSIKSFRVPEVYIEVPETATVGSLKRTVMEAVTAILGGGVRVGIALQGKKVRDDGRTLQQAGISESSALDTLGFTLEPSFTHASFSKTPVKRHLVMPCDTNQQFERSPDTPMIDSGISNTSTDTPIVTELDDAFDNNEFVSSSLETSSDTPMDGPAVSDSQALVLVPPVNVDALAVVPVNSKPKRSELSQRRTRRPFSVGEVEALVEAVEKLGTGRWRDVKMRAFENADHRTYVDLKDKWKTLVHTASITPQQRRGEPVPQELLNRVLSAHSYWTQNQPKQHLKQQSVEPSVVKMADAWEEVEGGGGSRL